MYATFFIVTINTITGVQAVEEDKIGSARSMGASEWRIMVNVINTASLPYIFTGKARNGILLHGDCWGRNGRSQWRHGYMIGIHVCIFKQTEFLSTYCPWINGLSDGSRI